MQHKRDIFLLALAQALFLATSLTSVSVVGLVGLELAPSPGMATIPAAFYAIGTALATIPASYLMKHTSRRVGFFTGLSLGILGFFSGLLGLYTATFGLIIIASFLQGSYQACALYYRFAAAELVSAENAGRAISMVLVGGVIAALLAPFGAIWATDYFSVVPYSGAYIFMLVMTGLAFIPVSMARLPKPLAEKEEESPRAIGGVFRQPATITAIACCATAWAAMVLMMSGAPVAMKIEGMAYAHSTQAIQWHVLAMYVPSFFTGSLIARFGILRMMMAGIVSFFAAILIAGSGLTVMHFIAALVALGIGWNFLFVTGSTLLTRTYRPSEKAAVQGVNEFTGFGASAIGAGSSAALITAFGWASLSWIAGALVLVTTMIVLINRRSIPLSGQPTASVR